MEELAEVAAEIRGLGATRGMLVFLCSIYLCSKSHSLLPQVLSSLPYLAGFLPSCLYSKRNPEIKIKGNKAIQPNVV